MKQHYRFPWGWKRTVATAAVPLMLALSCFSPKLSYAQGREAVAEQELTEATVRSKLGKKCPYAVARAIMDNKDNAKIDLKRYKAALDNIDKAILAAGYKALRKNKFMRKTDAFSDADIAFNILAEEKIARLFVMHPDKFVEMANAAGRVAYHAFDALRYEKMAAAFASEPDTITSAFIAMTKDTGECPSGPFYAFINEKIVDMFVKEPRKTARAFAEITKAAGSESVNAFDCLLGEDMGTIFIEHPDAIVAIAKVARNQTGKVLDDFGKGKAAKAFTEYVEGRITIRQFIPHIYSLPTYAIEAGRPLDDLHDQPGKRKKYLASLTTEQVFGLLMSDPAYFYTSTNHMLFDRLKKGMGSRTMSGMFEEHKCDQETVRNFLFRAINYGRFYGRRNSLFTNPDIAMAKDALLEPLGHDAFDNKYFFLLANSLDGIRRLPLSNEISEKLAARLGQLRAAGRADKDRQEIMHSMEFLLYRIDPATKLVSEENKKKISALSARGVFEPASYQSQGKTTVVQVFDRNDTEKNHWRLSQAWFAKYGKPKTGSDGELAYETASARIILFMGDEPPDNQKFISSALSKYPNQIITFRGHSDSLLLSFPPGIFENKKSNILFIPGNCGSAGSTADYISKNPGTKLSFFSNTSTGRGQVTNALVDALLEEKRAVRFSDIIAKHGRQIVRNGGDPSTISAWSPGEALLAYVNAASGR